MRVYVLERNTYDRESEVLGVFHTLGGAQAGWPKSDVWNTEGEGFWYSPEVTHYTVPEEARHESAWITEFDLQ